MRRRDFLASLAAAGLASGMANVMPASIGVGGSMNEPGIKR
ncbi:twin-arginine translocation signal domain-containing protein [Propionivibrio sp.]|nr:twin-arginine translocation signal domain-containing protein [Propionivibrio sp.]MBK8400845.1 twin-arginine translocation signal domain-containing protein [Propionivibrio sp.]MBK8744489.1 twin-arginine translocation signal domain-containing protein [Propionivibrio sp.]MBK8893150.1 twin-arginine translocation signal domain-containing protein [Propionivibrio sp.]MBL0207873.1 twin-arginine translocation signal domain-containing protein [Propionivibrio sp.]